MSKEKRKQWFRRKKNEHQPEVVGLYGEIKCTLHAKERFFERARFRGTIKECEAMIQSMLREAIWIRGPWWYHKELVFCVEDGHVLTVIDKKLNLNGYNFKVHQEQGA